LSPQNKSVFYFPFKGLVWKLLVDQQSSLLVVELREEETRQVNFTSIDLESKKILWQDLQNKEKWWTGLDAVKNGIMVLHGYRDVQNPEHQGIYVFNSKTGKYLWENKDLTFVLLEEKRLVAYDPKQQERTYHLLDLKKGNTLGYLGEMELKAELAAIREDKSYLLNSNHYNTENKYFNKIAGFVASISDKKPEGPLDYLEYKGKILVSFYTKEGEKLVNYLLVVNEEGEILLLDQIGSEISGIGLDTFFLFKDLLIFIKNKKELVIFEL
jgi:hypothetical protein